MTQVGLHRARFVWGPDRQLEIECVNGQGAVDPLSLPMASGIAFAELQPDPHSLLGVPAMAWSEDTDGYFEPFQLREQTSYFVDLTVPRTAFDAAGSLVDVATWPLSPALTTVFRRDPRRRWRMTDTSVTIGGEIRLLSHAGVLDLTTSVTGPLRAEVLPRKLRYRTELRALLNDLASELAELMLRVESPVTLGFSTTAATDTTAAALHFQLRHIMAPENLPTAADEIRARIHTQSTTVSTTRPLSEAIEIEPGAIIDDLTAGTWSRGGPLARLFRGHTPLELDALDTVEKVDVPENRFAKWVLEECLTLAASLETILRSQNRMHAVAEARRWQELLAELLHEPVWKGVGPLRQSPLSSTVLQQRSGYRDLLRFSLALRTGLSLSWSGNDALLDGLRGDVRPLSELYEYWCYFALVRAVRHVAPSEKSGGTLFEMTEGGLEVRLKRGRRSKRTFILKDGAGEIDLFYNRRFRRPAKFIDRWAGTYAGSFDPDYSLHLRKAGDPAGGHWLHFDAKYRVDRSPFDLEPTSVPETTDPWELEEGADLYVRELTRLYHRTDLLKMHSYRDSILGSRGAYILFPGGEGGANSLFVRHPGGLKPVPQFAFPGVGAFSFTPGAGDGQIESVASFLRSFVQAVYAEAKYTEEDGFFTQATKL